ncbi:MAG: cobyrinate a,c-diamide synthase [bacterium]|nr:cobyrinate a,c-diamide synthase [bacterium]
MSSPPLNTSTRQCPALFIAAPASGQGKTTVTAALARHYRDAGQVVHVFKTGPDFLDPMILEQASGNPVYQLDLWMGGKQHCRDLLYKASGTADLILIEGVMGLFDGEKSSADLATLFNIPVLAVINGSAMAQTFGALAHGLATYRSDLPFAGVFANQVASDSHFEMLEECLPDGLNMLGWLPRNEEIALPSRHLGIVQAKEIDDLDNRIALAALSLKDIQKFTPAPVLFKSPNLEAPSNQLEGLRIAIAQDDSFSFLYHANLDLLRDEGAELLFFSPLNDQQLPDADALYLPGGYPELHLDKLAANAPMLKAIRTHHKQGKPIHAECGGMLYLFDQLTNKEGASAELVGLMPGHAKMQKRLSNLGMHAIDLPEGKLRGHTYHYSKLDSPLEPIALSVGARKGRTGEPVFRDLRLNASYLHLYFPSNPMAATKLFASSNQSSSN